MGGIRKIRNQGLESMCGRMEVSILGSGRIIWWMELENTLGIVGGSMLGIGKMEAEINLDVWFMVMERGMKEGLEMGKRMDLVVCIRLTDKCRVELGRMENL